MKQTQQLGFGFDDMLKEQETAPSPRPDGDPFYPRLIERHHEALLAGDIEKARRETTVRTERKIYPLYLVLRMLTPDAYKDGKQP